MNNLNPRKKYSVRFINGDITTIFSITEVKNISLHCNNCSLLIKYFVVRLQRLKLMTQSSVDSPPYPPPPPPAMQPPPPPPKPPTAPQEPAQLQGLPPSPPCSRACPSLSPFRLPLSPPPLPAKEAEPGRYHGN